MFLVSSPKTIGPEFDHLAAASPAFDTPFRAVKPSKRAAVVACMRNEGILILEWVAHYRVLGFDSIFVYTNDNDDGSDELLLALHKAGIITVIWNECAPGVAQQFKAYRHAFWHLPALWDHEWCMFLDADEFLIPLVAGRMAAIPGYLAHIERHHNAAAVSLNWRWFAGDLSYERTDGMLFERFKDARNDEHVKTLFKLRDAYDVHVHCPTIFSTNAMIGGSGTARACQTFKEPASYELGQVNHYWQRSFEEFYIKRQRGSATDSGMRAWSTFFEWRGASQVDPHPSLDFIGRVRGEINHLRSFRAVRRARRMVEARYREIVASPDVRAAYEAAASSAGSGSGAAAA